MSKNKLEVESFNDFTILTGDIPLTNLPMFFKNKNIGDIGTLNYKKLSNEYKDEEILHKSLDSQMNTLLFEENRKKVEQALQAIAGHLFQKYNLSREEGVDIGSGSTGAMIEQFMRYEIEQTNWKHFEINSGAIEILKTRKPTAQILKGSYHQLPFENNSQEIITGLSSLDATLFLNQPLSEIQRVLKEGGYFVHLQDIRPGICASIEEAERNNAKEIQYTYEINQEILSLQINNKYINTVELFRRNLEHYVLQQPQLKILQNNWITATNHFTDDKNSNRYDLKSFPEFTYNNALIINNSNSPQDTQEASLVATVIQKI